MEQGGDLKLIFGSVLLTVHQLAERLCQSPEALSDYLHAQDVPVRYIGSVPYYTELDVLLAMHRKPVNNRPIAREKRRANKSAADGGGKEDRERSEA